MFSSRQSPQHNIFFISILLLGTIACFADNLLPNGDFEDSDSESTPASWRYEMWSGRATFHTVMEGRNGSQCARINSNRDGADVAWQTVVAVKPNTTYKLSGWIKIEGVNAGQGHGALLNVHGIEGARTKALVGTEDWTHLAICFNSNQRSQVTINCLMGGWGNSTGTAWYDDIKLEDIREINDPVSITLDISKTGHPISPYVYGQLIEHVGRCVYGGMWAEMLEDRKFFYPITDVFTGWTFRGQDNFTADALYTPLIGSPWHVVGPAGTVSMKKKNAFTGKHSPLIAAKGKGELYGIAQEHLGLVENRDYSGRIYLSGEQTAAPVYISLIWGEGNNQRQTLTVQKLNDSYTEVPLKFTAGAPTNEGRLEIVSKGQGSYSIGCVSLMPSDNVEGWRKEVIELLKEMNSSIYKWPGGNFVSGYDWREGIGERDSRSPRKNYWPGVEDNDVGVHEFMSLCQILDTEPSLAVSSGTGDEIQAAELVEYVNGSTDTVMGKRRAENGHPDPFNVKIFYVGNEMWGTHQTGYIPLNRYTKKHNLMVESMKQIDPTIQVVAVGRVGGWGERMIMECADYMDIISDNFYRGTSDNLIDHVNSMSSAVRDIVDAHRMYRVQLESLKNKEIPLTLDEWGYWHAQKKYGELGVQYNLEDALGIAAALHEMFRNSDMVQIAHYAQAVNALGAIKTSKTEAIFDTPGLVLKLYRNNMGTIPVTVEGAVAPLDVVATLSENKKYLTFGIVNPTEFQQKIDVDIANAQFADNIESYVIAGKDVKAFNEPGKKAMVEIQETTRPFSNTFEVSPVSVTLLKCTLR